MNRNEAGFTLIEMTMVIVLIATMLAFSIPNLRDGRIRQDIKAGARQFAGDLRYAQSQTLAQKVSSQTPDQIHAVGIYVDKANSQYTVFEDLNDDGQYDRTAEPGTKDVVLNIVTLQNDVFIYNIGSSNPTIPPVPPTGNNEVTIMFRQTSETGAIGSPTCHEIDCMSKLYIQFSSRSLPNDNLNVILNPSGLIQQP